MGSGEIKSEELVARYPGIEPDLAAVEEWMRGPVRYRAATEPMTSFAQRAQDMLDSYPAHPKEKARTDRIIRMIRRGASQWPIFLDAEDGFIMEGRHRIVAFHILGFAEVPVVYVSKVVTESAEGAGSAGRESLRVWLHATSGKTIPVSTQEDHGATVFEWPEQFGLRAANVERAEEQYGDAVMDALMVLVMKRGWVRINDQPDGHSVPLVMAASEAMAGRGVEWLTSKMPLPAVQVEIMTDPAKTPQSVRLSGQRVQAFAAGDALLESAGRESVIDANTRKNAVVESRERLEAIEDRIFAVYRKKHGLDINAFVRMGDDEIARHRAIALANRDRYAVPITDPEYLYHGTAKARLTQIAREGLKPSERSRWNKAPFVGGHHSLGRVFFTDNVSNAEFYAHEASETRPLILRVRRDVVAADMKPDPLENDGNYFIERAVPPEQIEIWTGKGWSGVTKTRK